MVCEKGRIINIASKPENILAGTVLPIFLRIQELRYAESPKRIAERMPMRHLVEPQDVAEGAPFLTSGGVGKIRLHQASL